MFFGPGLAVDFGIKMKRERPRVEIVYRHSPRDIHHSRFGIFWKRTAVWKDRQRRDVGDLAMPLRVRFRSFAARHVEGHILRNGYVEIRSFHPFGRSRRAVDRTPV